jgi:hypothetical protein
MTSAPRRRGDQIVSFKYSSFQPGVRESMGVREKYQIIPIVILVLHRLHFFGRGYARKKRLGTTAGMHLNLVGVPMTSFCDEPDLGGKNNIFKTVNACEETVRKDIHEFFSLFSK